MTEKHSPEFDHYQHSAPEYTEEVLWHRVYAVGAAALLLVALIGWGIFSLFRSDTDSNDHFRVEALAPSAAIPAASPAVPEAPEQDAEMPSANAATVADTVTLNADAQEDSVEPDDNAATAATQEVTPVVAEIPVADSAPEERTSENNSNEQITAAPTASTVSEYPVTVNILNQDITHAALTDQIRGLEPVRELSSTAQLGDGFLKLYFYTDLNGRAGDTLTYSWYRNDKRVARVRIPVGSDRWRSHASKNVSTTMRGHWKVVVTDRKGNTLATSEFDLKPGQPKADAS